MSAETLMQVVCAAATDWGSVADWVGAIGTTLAAVATVVALVVAIRQIGRERKTTEAAIRQTDEVLALQRERDRRDVEQRESSQAALISVVCQYGSALPEFWVEIGVRNNSLASVYDIKSFITESSIALSENELQPELSPSGRQNFHVPRSTGMNVAIPAGEVIGVTFRDNAGVRWAKWGNGYLERLGRDRDDSKILIDGTWLRIRSRDQQV